MRYNESVHSATLSNVTAFNKTCKPHFMRVESDLDNNEEMQYFHLVFDNDYIAFGDIFEINVAVSAILGIACNYKSR